MRTFFYTNLLLSFFSSVFCFGQTDSTQNGLSFDFGFTRGKNIEMWPLLKKYKDADVKETQILFSVYSRTLDYKNNTKHFHFYPFLSTDSSHNGKEIRIVSTHFPSMIHYQKDSLTRSFKFLELAPNISCFGIAKSNNGLYIDNNILFLLWYKNDQIAQKRKVIFFPAYWYWKDRNESNHLIFPIFKSKTTYSFSDTTYRKTLFPIYWSRTNKEIHNKVLFPIIWRYNTPYYKSLTLFPLFSVGHSKDSAKSESHVNALLLFHHRKKIESTSNVFFPIVWQKSFYFKNDTAKYLTIFPIYWSRNRASDKRKIVFPLLWSKTTFEKYDTTHRKILFPIYWSYKDKYKSHKILFPIVWQYNSPLHSSFTLFPLFSYGRSKDSLDPTSQLNILLLFSHRKELSHTKTTLFPIVWNKTDTLKHTKRRIAFPLLWSYQNDEAKKTVLFPLFWSFNKHSQTDTSQQTVLFPIYWSGKNKVSEHKVIVPFVWKFKNEKYNSLTLFPLFSKGYSNDSLQQANHLNILGIFTHLKDTLSSRDVLFPIVWNKTTYLKNDTTYRKTIFPFYWSYKDSANSQKVIFPIIHKSETSVYKSFTFIPFFSTGHSKDSARSVKHLNIVGIFNHLKTPAFTKDMVFPIIWNKTTYLKNDTIYNKMIFPIYWSYKDSANSKKVIFPIIYTSETAVYKSFTFIPFFSAGHSKDSARSVKHLNIVGIFNHLKTPAFTKDMVFPIIWNKTTYLKNDTTYRKTIFPIYWSYMDSANSRKVVFPLVWSFENPSLKSFTLFPLFSIGHSKDSAKSVRYLNVLGLYTRFVTPSAKKNIVLPLFWNKTTFEKDDTTRQSTFFPIYWAEKNKKENHKVLFPLVWSFEDQKLKSFTLFPLFSFGHSKDSARSFQYFNVLGIFTRLRQANERKTILFPIVWTKATYLKDDTIYRKTVFPLYWSKKDKTHSNRILFPIVWSLENKYEKSITLFPLFSVGHSKDSARKERHLNIALLFHHKVEPTKIRTRLFPIVWSKTKFTSYDTTYRKTVFPIYWSKTSKYKSYKVLFPIVWKTETYGYKSFTVFPIFSVGHSEDKKKRHFRLTPFIGWNKTWKGSNMYLFPVFRFKNTHSEKENVKKVSFLWPLCQYEKSDSVRKFRFAPIVWYKKTDTSSMFSIQPIHYFSKSKTQRTFILAWFLYRYDNQIGVSKGYNFLWKGFNHKKYSNGDHETRFLHLVYANVKKEGQTEKSIFPIYHKKTKPNGDKSTSVFFGFYNHFKQYKPEYKKFYEEERIFWVLRLRSNFDQLK